MAENGSRVSRRAFLRKAAGATVAGAVGAWSGTRATEESKSAAKSGPRSTVVLVRDRDVLDEGGQPDGKVLQRMLDEAVAALGGGDDPLPTWKRWFKPTDTVGVKTNVWRFLRTPRELEEAIRRRLIDAGVAENRISVDDRGVLGDPVFREATALVNVRPMRTHHWAGVGSLLKNHIMFDEHPEHWHGDSCANLAGLWDLPILKGKTRLNILVMLTPLFHSKGPHAFQKKYTWPYHGLLVGTDPVAVDATGLRILEARRLQYFGEKQPFVVSPKHIQVADEKFGLGVADPARIDLIKLGWTDGVLI